MNKSLSTQRLPICQDQELRCSCKRLLARLEDGQLVLKCPRCKREAVVSLGALSSREVEVGFEC